MAIVYKRPAAHAVAKNHILFGCAVIAGLDHVDDAGSWVWTVIDALLTYSVFASTIAKIFQDYSYQQCTYAEQVITLDASARHHYREDFRQFRADARPWLTCTPCRDSRLASG